MNNTFRAHDRLTAAVIDNILGFIVYDTACSFCKQHAGHVNRCMLFLADAVPGSSAVHHGPPRLILPILFPEMLFHQCTLVHSSVAAALPVSMLSAETHAMHHKTLQECWEQKSCGKKL